MKKASFICIPLVFALMLLCLSVSGQIPDPNNGGTGAPVGAPVDGGALGILIAGAAFAARKILRKNKR